MRLPQLSFGPSLESAMKHGAACAASMMLLGMLAIPAQAQREEIVQLQREMAQVQERIRLLEQVNANGFNEIRTLLQQAVDSTAGLSGDLDNLETSLNESMTTQQGMVAAPVQEVRSRMNDVSQSVGGMREDINSLNRRMTAIESTLADISRAVRELATQRSSAIAPPPPTGNGEADALLQGALLDLQTGKLDNAMAAATLYRQEYGDLAGAPQATFIMGRAYELAGQPEEAIRAYDDVLEKYPENPTTRDALYAKGVMLRQVGRNADAIATLESFIERYPTDANVQRARATLDELR